MSYRNTLKYCIFILLFNLYANNIFAHHLFDSTMFTDKETEIIQDAISFLNKEGYNVKYSDFNVIRILENGNVYLSYKFMFILPGRYYYSNYHVNPGNGFISTGTVGNEEVIEDAHEIKFTVYNPAEYEYQIHEILDFLVQNKGESGITINEIMHDSTHEVYIRDMGSFYQVNIIADLWEYSAEISKESKRIHNVITYTIEPPPLPE